MLLQIVKERGLYTIEVKGGGYIDHILQFEYCSLRTMTRCCQNLVRIYSDLPVLRVLHKTQFNPILRVSQGEN